MVECTEEQNTLSPKVSIIIATWQTGLERLNRLVRSLEDQSMPADEFEVIFVDDGSTDNTLEHLRQIEESHSNVRVENVTHSGWPSKPRNHGLKIARGEYVMFMDHDDALYPRALSAGYDMAHLCGSDVLNPKEILTEDPGWGFSVWENDIEHVPADQTAEYVMPLVPHKFYRREFLFQEGILFPENATLSGGQRIMGEDLIFNINLLSHDPVVTVLASEPCYHWMREGETASTQFIYDADGWCQSARLFMEATRDGLAERHATQKNFLLMHVYRSRVLDYLRKVINSGNMDAFSTLKEIQQEFIPEPWDKELKGIRKVEASLLRQGDAPRLSIFYQSLQIPVGLTYAQDIKWTPQGICIKALTRWEDSEGNRWSFKRNGDQIVLDVTDDIATALDPAVLDVTEEIQNVSSTIAVRSRSTEVSWLVSTEQSIQLNEHDGKVDVEVASYAYVDPQTVIYGRPLSDDVWDIHARNVLFERANQRRVRSSLPAQTALSANRISVAYTTNNKTLALDISQTMRTLLGSAPPIPEKAQSSWNRSEQVCEFSIPLQCAYGQEGSEICGRMTFGDLPPVDIKVQSKNGAVMVVGKINIPTGNYPVTFHIGDRAQPHKLIAHVKRVGRRVKFSKALAE